MKSSRNNNGETEEKSIYNVMGVGCSVSDSGKTMHACVARGWVHGIGKPNKDNVIACATDYIQCNRKGRDMLRLNIGTV